MGNAPFFRTRPGFTALRNRWRSHLQSTLFRPVLLIDEAQEMGTKCLNELRILGSANFDSEQLLTTVLCGDERLPERFRTRALLPLGSRIRARLSLGGRDVATMSAYLDDLLAQAGAPGLMTPGLKTALVEHAAGNLRVLTGMGADLLAHAAEQERRVLDEGLFLSVYGRTLATPRRRRRAKQVS